MMAVLSYALIVLECLLLFVALWVLKSLFQKRHLFKFARNYGGYRFYPILGNGYHVLGKDIFSAVRCIADKFGIPCNMWLGHDYYYITKDAAELKVILNHANSFDKMRIYENLQVSFGNSILLAPMDLWKKNRKHFAKSFSQPILNSFVHFFYKKSAVLVEILKTQKDFDPFRVFELYTFDSFCESIFGIDYDLQTSPKTNLVECVKELQDIGGRRFITYFYYPFCLWIFSREGIRALKLLMETKKFVADVLVTKRKIFAENPVAADTPLPLVDSMLVGKEMFTDKQIFEETFLFTTASTDTSGFTLAYFFTVLGMYPNVQQKVYDEIISVVGKDRPIYFDDLPNLKYTERALFESMRLIPVVPFLGRKATADLDLGTKVIPRGANIFVSIFDLHRNEKYWPDPLKYDPDRFLPEEVAKRDPYAFLPFSGGPRNCIGKTYSLMVMKTCIANVVRNFDISTSHKSISELKFTSCITMSTTHPLDCKFTLRKHD